MSAVDPLEGWEAWRYCYLSTVGRRTGKTHRIEIWFVVRDGALWLLTEGHGKADWVANLRVHPHATVELGERRLAVEATIAEGLPGDHPVRHDLAARYADQEPGLDAWAATALAVRLDPSVL